MSLYLVLKDALVVTIVITVVGIEIHRNLVDLSVLMIIRWIQFA